MLSQSQIINETEEKELLELERESLLNFQKEAKELLHIKNIDTIDIEDFKRDYIIQHSDLFKDDLIIRVQRIDELFYFLKNYK